MKDFLGYEVGPGDYFCYPLTTGRSATMALYEFVAENESGNVKARKVESTSNCAFKYKVFEYDEAARSGYYRDMSESERAKADAKTSTLHCFTTRACKLDYKGRAE